MRRSPCGWWCEVLFSQVTKRKVESSRRGEEGEKKARGGREGNGEAKQTMGRPFLFFVSSALLILWTSTASAQQRGFDYFVLSLQWPGSICHSTRHCCSSNGCCRSSSLPEFTIHGLWADYDDGTWPACCTHNSFDINKVTSLLPTLEKYWPSLYCGSTSVCFGGKGLFWAHEWEKHGTCSYPVIKDEYDYFSTTLGLYSKYNMTEVLTNAGILASNADKYLLADIVTTIKSVFGASPLLVCKHGSLEELRLCFHKDFKPRDCTSGSNFLDVASNSKGSCPRYISLPTYEPLGLGNGEVSSSFAW